MKVIYYLNTFFLLHRVIGSFDRSNDVLRVASVRLTEAGERQLCHCASQVAQQEMETLASAIHEQ